MEQGKHQHEGQDQHERKQITKTENQTFRMTANQVVHHIPSTTFSPWDRITIYFLGQAPNNGENWNKSENWRKIKQSVLLSTKNILKRFIPTFNFCIDVYVYVNNAVGRVWLILRNRLKQVPHHSAARIQFLSPGRYSGNLHNRTESQIISSKWKQESKLWFHFINLLNILKVWRVDFRIKWKLF